MLTTSVRATPRPDARVPAFTVVPQVVAAVAMGTDVRAARLAFVLATLLSVLLWWAGRFEHANPDLPAIRPAVAALWAFVCASIAPGLLGDAASRPATAAAWSSIAIALTLFLVPGRWSRAGTLLQRRAVHRTPPRHAAAYVSRRLAGVALVGAVAALAVPALTVAAACALLALVAVTVWQVTAPAARRGAASPG